MRPLLTFETLMMSQQCLKRFSSSAAPVFCRGNRREDDEEQ